MLAGIGAAVYAVYKIRNVSGEVIDQAEIIVTEKINPASENNIVYSNAPETVKNAANSFWSGLDDVINFTGTRR